MTCCSNCAERDGALNCASELMGRKHLLEYVCAVCVDACSANSLAEVVVVHQSYKSEKYPPWNNDFGHANSCCKHVFNYQTHTTVNHSTDRTKMVSSEGARKPD